MSQLDVREDLTAHPWTHLRGGDFATGVVTSVGLVPDGAADGRSTVAVLLQLDDGRQVIGQVSLALAAKAVSFYASNRLVLKEIAA